MNFNPKSISTEEVILTILENNNDITKLNKLLFYYNISQEALIKYYKKFNPFNIVNYQEISPELMKIMLKDTSLNKHSRKMLIENIICNYSIPLDLIKYIFEQYKTLMNSHLIDYLLSKQIVEDNLLDDYYKFLDKNQQYIPLESFVTCFNINDFSENIRKDFIKKHNPIDMYFISSFKFTETELIEIINTYKLNTNHWMNIFSRQSISEDFIIKYQKHITKQILALICKHQKLSTNFIKTNMCCFNDECKRNLKLYQNYQDIFNKKYNPRKLIKGD